MIGDERVHIPTSILDYWDERRYAHQSVCRFDDGIGELTAKQIMEIQKRKNKMVAEIQTWGVISYKDANLRGHRLPEVLVSNRKFTPMGFKGDSVEDSKVYCLQCLAFRPISLVALFCSRRTLGHCYRYVSHILLCYL
jgi:hypothetical protein